LNCGFDLNEFALSQGNRVDDSSVEAFRELQNMWKEDGNKLTLWKHWHDFRDMMVEGDKESVWWKLQCPVVLDDGDEDPTLEEASKSAKSVKAIKGLPCAPQ
jgi:hypothetical protein